MLIKVKVIGKSKVVFVEVEDWDDDKDKCKNIAFRYVNKRRPSDHQELVDSTYAQPVETVSEDTAKVLMSHVK